MQDERRETAVCILVVRPIGLVGNGLRRRIATEYATGEDDSHGDRYTQSIERHHRAGRDGYGSLERQPRADWIGCFD